MEDNYSLFEQREREHERALAKRPRCCYCQEPIQDEKLFRINGEFYHVGCAEEGFCERTEDYIV